MLALVVMTSDRCGRPEGFRLDLGIKVVKTPDVGASKENTTARFPAVLRAAFYYITAVALASVVDHPIGA